MRIASIIFGLGIALLLAPAIHAQNPDAVVGKWWNQEKEAQIEIYACEGKYCGKKVRGFMGISLIGKTNDWTRVK